MNTQQIERANHFHLVGDIAWFGLALSAVVRFLSVYAIRLGATPMELWLIASLPGLALLISPFFATWWRGRFASTQKALFLQSMGFRMVFLLPMLTPLFPEQWQIMWLVISVVLPAFPQGIAGTIFIVMMRESLTEQMLKRVWSRRLVALNICVGISTLLFGYMLEYGTFPYNYQLMFAFAFLFVLVSQVHVMRIRVLFPTPVVSRISAVGAAPVWRSPNFLLVILVVLVTHVAFLSVHNLTGSLFLIKQFGATEEFISLFGLAELLGGTLAAMFADRWMARIGTRPFLSFAMIGTAVAIAVIALVRIPELILLASILNGGAWTAAGIGVFGYFIERTPESQMPRATAAYQQMIGVATFVGPALGSVLATGGVSLVAVLLIGGVLRIGAAWVVAETRRSPLELPQVIAEPAGD